jgi:NADP-dependent 3-hydroxy acid dehydrogenase YdfG
MTYFQGKIVLITGASSGIGAALAGELSRRGATLGLVARRADALEKVAATLPGLSAWTVADVADRAALTLAVGELRRQLGPIDLAIANAGVSYPTRMTPINQEQIEEMFRVNLLGVIYTLHAVLPEMIERRCGHVAAVSSLAAYKGLPGAFAYCASKAAVNTYLEGLRLELRRYGIAVTLFCPGFIETPMIAGQKWTPLKWTAERAARQMADSLARRKKVDDFPWAMRWLMRLAQWAPDSLLASGKRDAESA